MRMVYDKHFGTRGGGLSRDGQRGLCREVMESRRALLSARPVGYVLLSVGSQWFLTSGIA